VDEMAFEIFQPLNFALDFLFAPLTAFPVHVTIFIFSFFLTSLLLGINRLLLNKNLVKQIRERMESARENLNQAQKEGNKENIQKFLNELMHINNQYMRQTIKTLFASLIVLAIFLPWLSYKFGTATAAVLPFDVPFLGTSISWLYWYVLVSFTIGWLLRRLFGFGGL
jgi:uncharacterized membrane protein (DUF106 family)